MTVTKAQSSDRVMVLKAPRVATIRKGRISVKENTRA
jgi:hypothetical protein